VISSATYSIGRFIAAPVCTGTFNWRFEDFLHSPGTSPNPFFGLIDERDRGLAPATP
jgi:hypothetical protein